MKSHTEHPAGASASPGPLPLSQLLQQARTELQAEPAPALSARVLASVGTARGAQPLPATSSPTRTPTRTPTRGWPMLATVSAACGLLLVAATTLVMLAPPPDEGGRGRDMAQAGFTPLVDAERWQRLSQEDGAAWVVNAELQQQRLASFGLPFDASRAAEPVRAELLMRASGEVLAVRVLR